VWERERAGLRERAREARPEGRVHGRLSGVGALGRMQTGLPAGSAGGCPQGCKRGCVGGIRHVDGFYSLSRHAPRNIPRCSEVGRPELVSGERHVCRSPKEIIPRRSVAARDIKPRNINVSHSASLNCPRLRRSHLADVMLL
jgi:hypothetical protein